MDLVSKPDRKIFLHMKYSSGILYHVSGIPVMNEYTIPLYNEHVRESDVQLTVRRDKFL